MGTFHAYFFLHTKGSAVFDFTGTGLQVPHNLNAPRQVTFSAILYCLRCMVGYDVPLNQVRPHVYTYLYIGTYSTGHVELILECRVRAIVLASLKV